MAMIDQSPCWADVKSKRLTAVREESSTQQAATNWNQPLYANERKCRSKTITERSANSNLSAATNLPIRQTSCAITTPCPPAVQANAKKEINKTIIKLSENGATSINNTFVDNHTPSSSTGTIKKTLTTAHKENREETAAMEGTLTKFNQTPKTPNVLPPPPPMNMLNHAQHSHHQFNFPSDALMTSPSTSASSATAASSSNTYTKCLGHDDGDIKIGGVAATMQRYQYANLQLAKLNKAGSVAADSSTYSNVNLNMESEKSISSSYNDGCSLSSAITEELKKRKAVSCINL